MSANDFGDEPGKVYRDTPPAMVGVYLSIKDQKVSFVLAANRKIGAAHLKILNRTMSAHNLEPVLPVITDILHEAMTAVRIGLHDGRSLANTADMQGAKIALAGRLQRLSADADEWRVTWSISSVVGTLRWQLNNVSYEAALNDGVERASRVLAGELPVDPYPLRKLLPMLSEDPELMEIEEKRSRAMELNSQKAPADQDN